jgi:ABC-2 type transport system permease protein
MMFTQMLKFEWQYCVRQPSFIVTMLLFFTFPFLSVAIENVQIGLSGNINVNSPYSIAQTIVIMGVFGMFLVVNFVAKTAIRNDVTNMSEILYTKPIHPFTYQLGRFLGAYLIVVFVAFMVPLGLFIGSLMPWLDPQKVGPINVLGYLQPYVVFTLPTYFVVATMFFAVALRFRSMMAVYLFALALFVLFSISTSIFSDPDEKAIVALSDPFAVSTFFDVTSYWTPSEKNTELVGLTGAVLYNRIIWLSVGLILLFSLGRLFSPLKVATAKDKKRKVDLYHQAPIDNDIHFKYSATSDLMQFWTRVIFEVKQVILSPAFIVLLLIAGVLIVSSFIDPPGLYDAPDWPLTQTMVTLINNAFSLSLVIVVTYYTAEVVWRERSALIGDIIDSMPVQNFTFWLSKLIAVSLVVILVLLLGMLCTIANQIFRGYLAVDITQYALSLSYFVAPQWLLLTILSFFIQALSPNKYVGMLIFVSYFFVNLSFTALGIEHNMFRYARAPLMQYSDMNGYGWAMQAQHMYLLYWGSFALVLSAFSFAMWQRGPDTNIIKRMSLLGYRLGKRGQVLVVMGIVGFISFGTIIHYNTRVLNEFSNQNTRFETSALYEKTFDKLKDDPVPTVTAVDINVAIFPSLRKLEAIAELRLENKTAQVIDKFLVNFPMYSATEITGATIRDYDRQLKTAWLIFDEPMQVNETRMLKVAVTRHHRGFKDANEDTSLVKNGTFINNAQLLPSFGVNTSFYLTDPYERRKNDLGPPKRANLLEDTKHHQTSMFGKNVGLIDFTATLSTSSEQIAIAPGYLQKYWVDGDRNYFVYEMDAPMLNFYNIMSADLEVKTAFHNGIDISVYYHREHYWNVDRMIESSIDSLDFFSQHFGPYQHKQFRIIEFPGYQRFAQSFANTVPYSERIGFISDLRDTTKIDPVYYVTAHEVAHQWFGHQLVPANVQGSAVLSESLSQYAALQVMLERYGEIKMRKFLTYELDAYLRGRGQEFLQEMPLMRAENQSYIHYRKGSIVMMAIADRIGYDAFNQALKGMLETFTPSYERFATTTDLVKAIKAVSSQEHYDFIDQQFSQITIYDLELQSAKITDSEASAENSINGSAQTIALKIQTKQFMADGSGNETRGEFSDKVDIVVFSDDPNSAKEDIQILYRQKHMLSDGENLLEITLSDANATTLEHAYVGVDPFIRYIDRNSADNIVKL